MWRLRAKSACGTANPPASLNTSAPDLAVEVLSPSDDMADLPRKVGEYFASGSEQVWLLEPGPQRATVYLTSGESRRYEADDEVDAGDLFTQG